MILYIINNIHSCKSFNKFETILNINKNFTFPNQYSFNKKKFGFKNNDIIITQIAQFYESKNQTYFCRDRFGEKPLYFGIVENNFIFGINYFINT